MAPVPALPPQGQPPAAAAAAAAAAPPQPPPPPRRETGPLGDRARREDCCVICFEEEYHGTYNNLVYCEGCNLGFHQQCYGIPEVPEGDYFCEFCVLANDVPSKEAEPKPVCELCQQKGGGLLRVWMVEGATDEAEKEDSDSESDSDSDSDDDMQVDAKEKLEPPPPSSTTPTAMPAFVHKLCALAAWNRKPTPLARFVSGSNGQVVAMSRGAVAAHRTTKATEDGAFVQWQDEDAFTCGFCGSGAGLLVRCPHLEGGGGKKKCEFHAHAACAFNASHAGLLVDDLKVAPLITVWCPKHLPEPALPRPGGEAVSRCMGFLLPPSHPLQQRALSQHDPPRACYGRLGGYLDDKLTILKQRLATPAAPRDRVVLCGREKPVDGCCLDVFAIKESALFAAMPSRSRSGERTMEM